MQTNKLFKYLFFPLNSCKNNLLLSVTKKHNTCSHFQLWQSSDAGRGLSTTNPSHTHYPQTHTASFWSTCNRTMPHKSPSFSPALLLRLAH